ncbi:hypothetical protein LZD49_26695 [Dyadobacter sp. CY261]|uniref:hypothetical protein n=1 Tax=Dyadobacter sp. CY261 TaxID=2907203 RepID=UPI001F21367B|nr:hypothetical protein [Dyadobacter sp. CY261]MCF0074100.1 hypothetical protein [Dyadobacter sp. CY261]
MKIKIYFIMLFLGFLLGCKKKEELIEFSPKPEPEPPGLTKSQEFLKGLEVTGATRIVYDSVSRSYMVSFPDNFTAKEADVKLALQPDVFLIDSLGNLSADTLIRYSYIGKAPLTFGLRAKQRYEHFFNVYFNFTGTPDIELLEKVIPVNARAIKIPIRFNARVGSIPQAPGEAGVLVKFTNPKTGFSTQAQIGDFETLIGFENSNLFITDDPFSLEIRVYNQTPVVFQGIRFTRDKPIGNIIPTYKFTFAHNDTIKIAGGFYLPQEKYKMTFSNDLMTNPVSVQMQFVDSNWIYSNKIPSTLSEGSYLMSVYESERLISNAHIYITENAGKLIETIWQGDINMATERNTNRVVIARGSEFYAKVLPMEYGTSQTNFDVNKLARLRLQSADNTVDLVPQLVVYNWSVALAKFSLGKYKVPNNLSPGLYAVTGIFTDGTQTKPYWCRIGVR